MNQHSSQTLPGRIWSCRLPVIRVAVSLSALGSFAATILFTHPALSPELMGPFAAIHGLLASGALAMLAYAGLMVVLWPLAQVMAALEAAGKMFAAAGLAAILPFAQATGPDGGAASSSTGGRAAAASHEIQIGAYGGYNRTRPSTVRMVQPGGTDLTFTDVKWIGESFKPEPYWGVRTTYWSPKLRGLGFMFDYAHAKATALKSQDLSQTGKRDGQDVPPKEPFGKTFRKLEFTHGLNFFTLNALYRARGLHARIAPYAGIGIGLSVPHVDTKRAGAPDEERTYEHQITGLAFQALGGIEWRLLRSGRVSAFTEYKLTRTSNNAKLNGGGTLDTDLWTHQVPVGFSYHHWLGVR
jgi:lipid A oxidase